MAIDWKAIPKIDAHIHLMPEDVIKANSDCGDRFVDNGRVRDYLTIMNDYHIERAFIMPFNDPYMLSMDFTVQAVHANLQNMVQCAPTRLKCFADVDIRISIDQTLQELERALAQDEFIGIKLHPTNVGYPIDGDYYDRIFRYANDRRILVELHAYPRPHLPDDVCSPRRIRQVLARYPALRLSIAHLGGTQWAECCGLNAWFNLSAILPDLVNQLGVAQANQALRAIGVDKLVFATDYPDSRRLAAPEIYETYFDLLGQMDFTPDEAARICKYNALEMLSQG